MARLLRHGDYSAFPVLRDFISTAGQYRGSACLQRLRTSEGCLDGRYRLQHTM